MEEKETQVLSEIQFNDSVSDIEACHRIGKGINSSKKSFDLLIENTQKKE